MSLSQNIWQLLSQICQQTTSGLPNYFIHQNQDQGTKERNMICVEIGVKQIQVLFMWLVRYIIILRVVVIESNQARQNYGHKEQRGRQYFKTER